MATDRIDRACREARKLGLSYGKYKAMLYERQQKQEAARTAPRIPEEEYKAICPICGTGIPYGSRRKKYCCEECAEEAGRRKAYGQD